MGGVSGAVSRTAVRDLPALTHVPPVAAHVLPASAVARWQCVRRRVVRCSARPARPAARPAMGSSRAPCLPVRWRLAGGAEGGVPSAESCAALLCSPRHLTRRAALCCLPACQGHSTLDTLHVDSRAARLHEAELLRLFSCLSLPVFMFL